MARLTGNATYRFAVPFLMVIGRGLGVPLHTMGVAASAGDFTGLASPLVGRGIDRSSRKHAMVSGMVVLVAAAIVASAATGPAMLAAAFVTLSFGKALYDFAMGAWLADRVAYARRGEVVGVTELAWAGSMLTVVPVLGLVTALSSWRVAYVGLALLNAAAGLAIATGLPHDERPAAGDGRGRLALDGTSMRAFLAFGLQMTAANFVFVTFGAWLTDEFGFGTGAIGATAILLGLAELAATSIVIAHTDRLGKARSLLLSAAVMAPCALALGATGRHTVIGLALLTVYVMAFEFGIVSAIPLITALQPSATASAFGIAAGLGTMGRGVASIVSTRLYEHHGMGASGAASAVCSLAIVALVGLGVREPDAQARAR
jgi:predicted MFS family arabinose efflux permease